MDFYGKYTTKDKVDKEIAIGKDNIEQEKTVLSNDTFAECEMLKELCFHIGRNK